MRARSLVLLALATSLVAAAGCGTAGPLDSTPRPAGDASASPITDFELAVVDGRPAAVTTYAVGDYATLLIESPTGTIVAETTVSPNRTTQAVTLPGIQSGEYRAILRRGGDTLATTSLDVDGPNPTIESITPQWDGGQLVGLTVTVANTGDAPVDLDELTVSALNSSNTDELIGKPWLAAGHSRTLSMMISKYSFASAESPGTVTGSVTIETSAGKLSGSFETTFDGPALAIVSIEPTWDENRLAELRVAVKNSGDLDATGNVSVIVDGTIKKSTKSIEFAAGSVTEAHLGSFFSVYNFPDDVETANVKIAVFADYATASEQIRYEAPDSS